MPANKPQMMEMFERLIASPTVSSVSPEFDMGNREICGTIGNWLEDLGFSVEMQPIPGHPDKANVIGTLGKGPGGLVLAGHTDTVPFDDGKWDQDPFSLTEHNGRLYGLGTCDMKGFLALAIHAASQYRAEDLAQPLIIVGTADEESSMMGGRALAEAGRPKARHAIIGEPTGLRPVHMHKGMMMDAIRVLGRSGHSSDPSLGVNALDGMHRVLAALISYRDSLAESYRSDDFNVPFPTLNLGYIRGGDNPNRICPECELHIDLRPLPGMSIPETREVLYGKVRDALGDTECGVEFDMLFEGVEGMETESGSELVRLAEELTGHSAEAVAFSTEGPFFRELGAQTVILGPGNIDQAHQPNEYLAMDMLQPTLDHLDRFINQLCVNKQPKVESAKK